MSVMYCEYCHGYIDTDFNVEHFTDDGDCVEKVIEDLKDSGYSDDEIEKRLGW